MKIRHLASLTVALGLTACGTITPAGRDLVTADFGAQPSEDVMLTTMRAQVGSKLKDPYSAVYSCQPPGHGWANTMGHLSYGWLVVCTVNAKNSFGGYTGPEEHHFLMQGSTIVVNGETTIARFSPA